MGGEESTMFNSYFRMLVYAGFCAAKKHMNEIVNLVEMMLPESRKQAVIDLKNRFKSDLSEKEFAKWVRSLVDDSINAWSTNQYDAYQKLTNGIL